MRKSNKSTRLVKSLLRLAEQQLAFVLAGLAVLAFIFSYSFAATQEVSIQQTAESSATITPVGSSRTYTGVNFSSNTVSGMLAARTAGSFSKADVAFTAEGAVATTDNTPYTYTLSLNAPVSGTWYVSHNASGVTLNGQAAGPQTGVILTNANSLTVSWTNGSIYRLSRTAGSSAPTQPTTPAELEKQTASLFVAPSTSTVPVGMTRTMLAFALDASNRPLPVNPNWKVSNARVATIDANGVLNAVAAGRVTVTAELNSLTASASITVIAAPTATLPVPRTITQQPDQTPAAQTDQPANTSEVEPAVPFASDQTNATECPAQWIGDECAIDLTNIKSADELAQTAAQIALEETATSADARTIARLTANLNSADAVAARYEATGKTAITATEVRAAVAAQPTITGKAAVAVALTTNSIIKNVQNFLVGYSVTEPSTGNIVAARDGIFSAAGRTLANLFLGGDSSTINIPGRGAGADTGEGTTKITDPGDEN